MIGLQQYKEETEQELHAILQYWTAQVTDTVNGGFYGRIDGHNVLHPAAEKGGVLNARILWSYSAACNQVRQQQYLDRAHRAYGYIVQHFIDPQHGGVYWSVDAAGNPFNTRKQVYGQVFMIYALSEYYLAAKDPSALELAIRLFHLVEQYSFDTERGGYLEAFTRNWLPEADLRLSEKDENEKKTMNTHLHVLEAYAALYRVWKDEQLRRQITGLLDVFVQHIIDPHTHHLQLFFDEQWRCRPGIVSYGHDIEAGWLLQEAAEIIEDAHWIAETKRYALLMTQAAMEQLDADGGLWYETEHGLLVKEKHWWPQAEAMVGFFNVYQHTGNAAYLQLSVNSWEFIKKYLRDQQHGEWYWGVYADYTPMLQQDKAGFWKCPYHNTRACIEIIKRCAGILTMN